MAREAVTAGIAYPSWDGLPIAESDSQGRTMTYAIEALDAHFGNRPDVFVSGNLFLYHHKVNGTVRVAPDVFVVFGATKRDRSSYLLRQESKAPDFVLEIASESTWRAESGAKRNTYAALGVSEYWLYDPTGNYLVPPLQGLRLTGDGYEPLPVRGDDTRVGRSEVLGLELRLYPDDRFRYHDPTSGRDLLNLQEEQAARQDLEAQMRDLRRRLGRGEGEREDQGHGG